MNSTNTKQAASTLRRQFNYNQSTNAQLTAVLFKFHTG